MLNIRIYRKMSASDNVQNVLMINTEQEQIAEQDNMELPVPVPVDSNIRAVSEIEHLPVSLPADLEQMENCEKGILGYENCTSNFP